MSTAITPYVIITPARNEAKYIEKTIQSVIQQTMLPLKWVIVNDGSLDNTAELVRPYLPEHPWMELVDLPVRKERHFAAKVYAFNAGQERVKDLPYQAICNLDADVSLDPDHFEFLLNEIRKDPRLGVTGTTFKEEGGYDSGADSFEGRNHVSGQCQMFRRECFEEIGGYRPNKAGGIDWMAVTTARMMGWTTRSFRERPFFHHRSLGTAERGRLASSFSYGEKDYYLGGHPVWQLFRVTWRMTKKPYLIDGIAVALGYVWAFVRREHRPVSPELMKFHRGEQMHKLAGILRSLVRMKRVDNFEVRTQQ